jgi:hypothetical protein
MASDNSASGAESISNFGRELRRTWTAISIVLTAASIWALIARTWKIDLSALMELLREAYEAVFHSLMNTLFAWLPFKLTDPAKDLLVIWLAVGASLARTFFFLFETGEGKDVPKWSSPLISRQVDNFIFKTPIVRSLLLVVAVLLWPIAMVLLLRKPKLCFSRGGQKYALVGGAADIPTYGGAGPAYTVKHDLRLVFAWFLLLVALCVAGFSALNAMGFALD